MTVFNIISIGLFIYGLFVYVLADNVMFDNTITFTGDNTVQYIQVIAMDDVDIELMETLCLELTSPTNEHAFLHSITQTTVIIRDDDRKCYMCILYKHFIVHVLQNLTHY